MFADLQQHIGLVRIALAIVMWLACAGALIYFLDEFTRRHPPQPNQACWPMVRCALRTLPIAFLFSPGFIGSAMAGIPAPATFLPFACLLMPEVRTRDILEVSVPVSIMGFLGLWFLAWLVSLLRSAIK